MIVALPVCIIMNKCGVPANGMHKDNTQGTHLMCVGLNYFPSKKLKSFAADIEAHRVEWKHAESFPDFF